MIKIPEDHIKYFESYFSINDDVVNEIIQQVEKAPSGLKIEELLDDVSEHLKIDIDKDKLRDIISLMFQLCRIKYSINLDDEDLLEEIKESLADYDLEADKNKLNNLGKILKIRGSVASTTKVIRALRNNENILIESEIFPNIRPIFNEDNTDIDGSALYFHLKLMVSEAGQEPSNLYFAMDSNDLVDLKNQISEAELKTETLKNNFNKLRIIELG